MHDINKTCNRFRGGKIKKMTSVCILLSTYNGEKYIEEQLQSIFSQSFWQNCTLFVRDDGSKDGTVEILRKYEAKGKLKLTCGENIGYAQSFLTLLKNAQGFDYYSFCDQDDFWLETKIERAVTLLEKENKDKPLLYFSDCYYCDKDLQITSKRKLNHTDFSFEKSLFDCWALGFTFLINKKMFDLLAKGDLSKVVSHDHYIEMAAILFGKTIYDDTPTAKYRRHQESVSISANNFIKLYLKRFSRFLSNEGFKYNNDSYKTLLLTYGETLSSYEKHLLQVLISEKRTFSDIMFFCLNKSKYRNSTIEDFFIRILFLFGKL